MDDSLIGSSRRASTRRPPRGGGAGRRQAPARPQTGPSGPARREHDRTATTAPRTPFVLLVLGLLGGGLVCLLVINTTLGAASFKISQLQQTGTTLAQQEQTLQGEVSTLANPAQIEQQAYRLGMRQQSHMRPLIVGKAAAGRKAGGHHRRSQSGSDR